MTTLSEPRRDARRPCADSRVPVRGLRRRGALRRVGRAAAVRSLGLAVALLAAFGLGSCGSDGGGGTGGPGDVGSNGGNAELVSIRQGRLADVFGLRETDQGIIVEQFQKDVLIGPDIEDERPLGSNKRDEEIVYDFISSNPDTLQPRILITRLIGSADFDEAFAALGARARVLSPGIFGQDTAQQPFSVVPRNAAFEVTFSENVGVDIDFFVERDANGMIVGVRNTEAVQLLEIVGDPNDNQSRGDFRVVPIRVVPRGNTLIIDPVLLGTEGAQYGVRNNAAGMPESPDQSGANMRLALALEGPLSIDGLSIAEESPFVGGNNQGARSIIRDFRSGNRDDNTPDIARGFVRESEPPRILGEMLMFLERVDPRDERTQVVTIYKGGKRHEIDRGDVLRFIDPATGRAFASAEVVVDPEDDAGEPGNQRVRCIIEQVPNLEELDSSNLPGFPAAISERPAFLRANGTKAILIAEYTDRGTDPVTGELLEVPSNFIRFSPTPLPLANGEPSAPSENVSPFAEAIVRFTKPVDLDTVRAADSFFFATRDVLSDAAIQAFITERNIDPDRFNRQKFITPHLVASRRIDEDGSQTSIRLQPTRGFYLDEEMRNPPPEMDLRYFMHVVGGRDGIRDLAGNPIDFQPLGGRIVENVVIPFTLDTRNNQAGVPNYPNNLVVSVVRRFADVDEDEQPSIYLDGEFPAIDPNTGLPLESTATAFPLEDVFGAVVYTTEGRLVARPTTRVTKVVDDLNQIPPPPQSSDLRFCPLELAGENLVASSSAVVRFGQGIQNPLNPFGARLQTVWREIDLSLSRIDPGDFNLDVEQMYWAPFTGSAITYDVFDRVSLFLGHSEWRPEPCVGAFSSQPELPNSGLKAQFEDNYAHNLAANTGEKTENPAPHPAYLDRELVIDAGLAFTEPNGINRYLPLPDFQEPYFVYRDERLRLQGGNSGEGADVRNANQDMPPYIISPSLVGYGRLVTDDPDPNSRDLVFNRGFWGNFSEFLIQERNRADRFTGGGVSTIALPLLADFWTYCDDPDLPDGFGFIATGFNGWQIALSVQSGPQPNFRAYSGGFAGNGTVPPRCVDTATQDWQVARGGYTPTGQRTTRALDNSVYWMMTDFLKRQSVATFGFVDLFNPHRMPGRQLGSPDGDPRLGPYLLDGSGQSQLPQGVLAVFDYTFEPPLESLPGGTQLIPEFRAATAVDPEPWRYNQLRARQGLPPELEPDEINFPLDPLKAHDAHMRKFDDRPVGGSGAARNHWAYYYNREVTDYTTELSDLSDTQFISQYGGPNTPITARDVRYVNWRFVMVNNVAATPPIAPSIESFAMTYRFERRD